MSKKISTIQDIVIIGAGTSGIMCALGALHHGLKVTLVGDNLDFTKSSLLAEVIPTKSMGYCADLAYKIKQAQNFGLNPTSINLNNLDGVNNYIKKTIEKFQQDDDLELFEKLGGNIVIGNASFINPNSIMVGKQKIYSKNFVIATGTQENIPNILYLSKNHFTSYRNLFDQNILINSKIIIGGKPESLEIAQSLARLGCKVELILTDHAMFKLIDAELSQQLLDILTQEGISIHFVNKILEFNTQNNRKVLICENNYKNKIIIAAEEIINLYHNLPNVETLALHNANVQYNNQGIWVNNQLNTTQSNVFAIGSVINQPFQSIHFTEHQVNVLLSNIACNQAKNINLNIVPKIFYTYPQLASVGITTPSSTKDLNKSCNYQTFEFEFKNIDAAIYQQQTLGKIKLCCNNNKIVGATILGTMAAEIIHEYSLAIQLNLEITEFVNNIHIYPSLSQINKRVAYKALQPYTLSSKFENFLLKICQTLSI